MVVSPLNRTNYYWEENMELYMEPVTRQTQFWDDINALALEAFPPEEYLAPSKLVEMTKGNVDFWALSDNGRFVGFMVLLKIWHIFSS